MIAEIHNKSGVITKGSEDELTGNFFGSLRYLSFNKGLKPILKSSIRPQKCAALLERIYEEKWDDRIEFWLQDTCEPDILISFDDLDMIIEVKYKSGLSSEDQLEKYGDLLIRRSGDKDKVIFLLADDKDAYRIYNENVTNRKKSLLGEIPFGYMTWQNVYDALIELGNCDILNTFDRVIISDLTKLLCKKGFEGFRNFEVGGLTVKSDETWEFDDSFIVINDFSFEIEKNIERGLYYEFR